MNSIELDKYIENPGLLNKDSLVKLSELITNYPYFQTVHKLYLKNLKQIDISGFNKQLDRSSVHISDRSLLYFYLNSTTKDSLSETNTVEAGELELTESYLPEISENSFEEKGKEEENKETAKPKLLQNQNVRRKIKEGAEGMGDNISVTISSQIDFVKLNKKDKLEYSPEIYFIEEEKLDGKKIVTIDASPDKTNNKSAKDLLQIDETQEIEKESNLEKEPDKASIEENIELIESPEVIQQSKKSNSRKKSNQGFDISHYADEDEILKNADENDLITKFITVNPKIEPVESYIDEKKDISEHSIKEDENLLTETLARVYIAQGYFDKAIKSYEKLCLKYPEKSTYFADQIEMIKELINKQQNK